MSDKIRIIKQGQRYRTLKDIPVQCLISWEGTSVTSHQAILPRDEVIYIFTDTGGNRSIAHCVPEDYKRLQSRFVSWFLRALFWMYRGYYLSIQQQHLAEYCEYLGTAREQELDAARSAATAV